MHSAETSWTSSIHIKQVETAVMFAVRHIPDIDQDTLHKFLDYVQVAEDCSELAKDELLEKMRLVREYLPHSCKYSLLILADLLELVPSQELHAEAAPKSDSRPTPRIRPQPSLIN